jgi:hypothetical protein
VTERLYSAPAQSGDFALSSYRESVTRCLKGAARCRLEADQAQSAFEEEAWLDLAGLWAELAESFKRAEPTLH